MSKIENIIDKYLQKSIAERKKFSIILKKINQWLAFIDDEKEMIKVAEKKNDKLKEARIEMNYLT